jgi:hypothetical protein
LAHSIAFRLVRERLHGDHRAEDLPLDHLVALFEPGDDGGLEEVAGQVGLVAAGDDPGARRTARAPGAWERTQEGLAQASRGEGKPLDELTITCLISV